MQADDWICKLCEVHHWQPFCSYFCKWRALWETGGVDWCRWIVVWEGWRERDKSHTSSKHDKRQLIWIFMTKGAARKWSLVIRSRAISAAMSYADARWTGCRGVNKLREEEKAQLISPGVNRCCSQWWPVHEHACDWLADSCASTKITSCFCILANIV